MKSPLINRVLTAIAVSDDNEWLQVTLDDGQHFFWQTEGDCCSQTWIEHVNVLASLPSRVQEVKEHTLNEWEQDYSTIQAYTMEIVLETGTITIEYRNASNGYYGGSLRLMDGQRVSSNTNWRICK